MKRTLSILLTAALMGLYSLPVWSWGQEGHRIIAKIAYDNLTPKAKKSIDRVIGTKGMIFYANWADEIKSDNIYPQSIKDGWHYQDFDGGMSDSLVADALTHYPAEGGNMFRVLDSLEVEMAGERISKINTNHILWFLVHLSGDRYCPMHMAHMDDKGGNAVKMKWFKEQTNLHTVWDTHLIASQGYSYTEYAEMLELRYADEKKHILSMSDEELLIDNYHMTEAIYKYQETWDGNTYHYIYTWCIPMEKQLYIAGIRLAQVLNKIYK